MKTIKRFFLSTVAVTAALITGCTPEEEHMPVQGGDSFTLSSSEEQVITRAGDVSVSLRVALNTGCTDLCEVRGTRNFLQ